MGQRPLYRAPTPQSTNSIRLSFASCCLLSFSLTAGSQRRRQAPPLASLYLLINEKTSWLKRVKWMRWSVCLAAGLRPKHNQHPVIKRKEVSFLLWRERADERGGSPNTPNNSFLSFSFSSFLSWTTPIHSLRQSKPAKRLDLVCSSLLSLCVVWVGFSSRFAHQLLIPFPTSQTTLLLLLSLQQTTLMKEKERFGLFNEGREEKKRLTLDWALIHNPLFRN